MTSICRMAARGGTRVAVGATALLAAGALVAPAASAHPLLLDSSPANGQVVSTAPARIVYTFDESGTLNGPGGFILDGQGQRHAVASAMSKGGTKGTLTPKAPLGHGPYESVIQIQADDDKHIVQYPVVFCVGSCPGSGAKASTTTDQGADVTIDGMGAGTHTITLATKARTGTVSLMSDVAPVPVVWNIHGNGTVAKASVILPYAATWTAVFDFGKGRTSVATLIP